MTALEALGEQLAGIPGRKSMVWIGGCQIKHGLLLQIAAADVHFRKAGERTIADLDVAIADRVPDGGFSFRVNAVQLERFGDTVRYAHSWELARGTSTVLLIVRDRSTGRFGTLDLPVK